MRASTIYLFNVPWTYAYDNLPAGLESLSDMDTLKFLCELYGTYSIDFTTAHLDYRSFKSSDGSITVPIPVDATTILTEYNYAAIVYDRTVYFYFIRNSLSLYDNVNTSTCSLDLEFDVYLNNRRYFLTLDPQLCVRAHVKDLFYDPRVGIWSSNGHYVAPPVSTFEKSVGAKKMVCWGRLCTSGDFFSTSGQSYMIDGCYPSQKITPYIMFPLFVLDPVTFKILPSYWEYDTETPEQIDLSEIRVNNIEEIIQFDLTYYPPFDYEVEEVSGRYRVRTMRQNASGLWSATTKESILYNTNECSYLYYKYNGKQIALPCVTGVVKKAEYNFSIDVPTLPMSRSPFTPSDDDLALSSPQMSVYPVSYHALYVNGGMMPLIFPPSVYGVYQSIYWTIDPSEVTPRLTLKYYGGRDVYETKPIPLSNHGFMPTASSQYDAFLRANGNKITAEQQAIYSKNDIATGTAVLSAAKGVASASLSGSTNGLINTGVGFATSMMTAAVNKELALDAFYAKINDLKNAQDSFSIPSANAMSAILQDLVVERAFAPSDRNEVMSLYTDLTYYGFEKTSYRSITEATHECYDYVQTAKAYFPQIPNLAHRRVLEAAFNRGVTLWHFDLLDDFTEYGDAVQQMDRNVTNLQIREMG